MDVTLLYFDGCPNWRIAEERLSALADELDLTVTPGRSRPPRTQRRPGSADPPPSWSTAAMRSRKATSPSACPAGCTRPRTGRRVSQRPTSSAPR